MAMLSLSALSLGSRVVPPSSTTRTRPAHGRAAVRCAAAGASDDDKKNHTVLVCGNKTCRRQGSLNTLQFFQQLTPDQAGRL
jgi:hypothetical protein